MSSNTLADLTEISKKWLDRMSPLLLLLAVLWLCWELSRAFWLFLSPIQAPTLPVVAKQTSSDTQTIDPNTFAIFAKQKSKPKVAVNLPPPSNIKLKGIMIADPHSSSSALLAVSGKFKNYRVGQQLDSTSYTLDQVEWNTITLADPSGGKTVIELNQPFDLNQNQQDNQTASNVSNPKPKVAPPVRNMQPTTSPVEKPPEPPTAFIDKALEQAAIELEEDPAGYLSQAGILATGDGYEITDAMPSALRSRVGLRSGDKIISVNGNNVGSTPTTDADLLREISKSRQASIKVKRGEQVITIRQSF